MATLLFDLTGNILTDQVGATPLAAHPDLLTDTLYAVVGTDIVPYRAGAVLTSTWRSKRFVLNRVHGFGWLRLNGEFSAGAVARVYRDGVLFHTTPAIVDNEPVRLPAGRSMRWELEIESVDRLTSAALASTVEELRQFGG